MSVGVSTDVSTSGRSSGIQELLRKITKRPAFHDSPAAALQRVVKPNEMHPVLHRSRRRPQVLVADAGVSPSTSSYAWKIDAEGRRLTKVAGRLR
ncbi:hypothetical protein MTO96_048117 [Rhipicephalus appendiculatus]